MIERQWYTLEYTFDWRAGFDDEGKPFVIECEPYTETRWKQGWECSFCDWLGQSYYEHWAKSLDCWHKEQAERKALRDAGEGGSSPVPCSVCDQPMYTRYREQFSRCVPCYREAQNAKRRVKRQAVKCQCCGNTFTAPRSDAKFCSNACRQAAHRNRNKRNGNP